MKINTKAATLGFCYMTLGLSPVYADDTDIFLGNVSATTVKPNVLFILDNSGSMADPTSNTDSTSRLITMKNSMQNILDTAQGINAGIMQFNDPGAAILYPVSDLDAPLVKNVLINSSVNQREDDASQSLSTVGFLPGGGDSSVTLNGNALVFGSKPASVTLATFTIQTDNDDAEQLSNNSVDLVDDRIEMQQNQTNAYRFQNVTIPTGATIQAASLEFEARRGDSQDTSLTFYAENIANSPALSATNNNISSRAKTSASMSWTVPTWSNNGTKYNSPDMKAVIQEVINNALWASNNSLTIIQTHASGDRRRARSHDNSSSKAAKLNVAYSPAGAAAEHQRIGLRFQNIDVPRGATITSAYIAVTPSVSNTPDAGLSLEIKAEDVQDAGQFTTASGDLTSTSTVSTVVPWTAGDWIQNQEVQTPSLVTQLQQITNRSDWCGGNSVAFYIEPTAVTTLNRAAYSYDANPSKQPRLVVEYDQSTVPASTCGTAVINRQISGRPNDAEESSNTSVNNNSSDIDMNSGKTNGFRFENLPIVKGATILDARIIFTAKENGSSSQTITFKAQDSVVAPNFPENNSNITNRTSFVPGSVTWSSSTTPALTDWSQDVKYTTPDLKALLQPLVNNTNWNPASNGVAIIQTASSSNNRAAYSYDGSASGSAILQVKVNLSDIVGGSSNSQTVRTHLKNIVSNIEARTWTPIVDTLYEAALYYRGEDVYWGKSRDQSPVTSNTDDKWKRVSDMASHSGGTLVRPNAGCTDSNLSSDACRSEYISGTPRYKSPITDSCQQNYIVLLTDGLANHNNSAALIKSKVGITGACSNTNGSEACSEDLVEWLANNDMSTPTVGNNAPGDNPVNTFTIAFSLDDAGGKQYLSNLATKGKGTYYEAGSESALTDAFNQIIGDILTRDATFVVPGTTVSQFNRLSHFEDLYFSVFKPAKTPRWDGNLKKYKISHNTTSSAPTATPPPAPTYGRIVGMNDQLAVDPTTGFFFDNVSSFWNSNPAGNPDGFDVTKGGSALQLPTNPDNRKVFTYYSGASTTLKNNPLDESNAAITSTMLGFPTATAAYRQDLLNWARGEDVEDINNDGSRTDARLQYGDPLHSAPVAITYGGTAAAPIFAVFFATNDGFLHAVDNRDGSEYFSFIPELLLPNLKILFDNSPANKHPYGIDGNITRWVTDVDKDGIIEPSDGDKVYIYFGLRRGGSNYYALDVTDLTNPKLMWQIEGDTSPYDELGQSWSQPVKARVGVDVSGTIVQKDVLIFGGGYDVDQDNALVKTADDEGRAIFMVEAGYPSSGITPSLIWSAGKGTGFDLNLAAMDYSIPSLIKIGDTNGDGLVDVMFAADLGGQVWRFDVNNGQPASTLATGGVIADLAGTSAADSRRFYAGVDAATIVYKGQRKISLTLGSGWRANPLDETVQDRFYMITQQIAKPATYTKLTESDLYDATLNLAGSSDPTVAAQAQVDLSAASGWYITLAGSGEKVLSPSVTANAQILFTTYQPKVNTNPCEPSPGEGFLYGVNALNATPFIPDVNGNPTRKVSLDSKNIPPSPTLIVLPDGTTRTLVGPEEEGELIKSDPIHKTYWFDE